MFAHALPHVLTETVLTVSLAASRLSVDPATIRRWIVVGLSLNGKVVHLEGAKVGTRFRTSQEAVARFLDETQTVSNLEPLVSQATLNREATASLKKLRKMGVKC